VKGTFTPTAEAKALSKAPHFQHDSTPVVVRFSNSTGIPVIPDTDSNSVPRGFAVRFMYDGEHKHTDIIGHSTPHFPVRTGHDFLEFFTAILGGKAGEYVSTHASTAAFVTAPKPFAASFATESYYALNAFKFTAPDGSEQFVRYQVKPAAGNAYLSDEEVKAKSADYEFEELADRLKKGPIELLLYAQLAEEGDPTDDVTQQWPDDRKQVLLGKIVLDALDEDSVKNQKHLIFDPIPRVEGVVESDDPILDFRAALYLISGRERRKA